MRDGGLRKNLTFDNLEKTTFKECEVFLWLSLEVEKGEQGSIERRVLHGTEAKSKDGFVRKRFSGVRPGGKFFWHSEVCHKIQSCLLCYNSFFFIIPSAANLSAHNILVLVSVQIMREEIMSKVGQK